MENFCLTKLKKAHCRVHWCKALNESFIFGLYMYVHAYTYIHVHNIMYVSVMLQEWDYAEQFSNTLHIRCMRATTECPGCVILVIGGLRPPATKLQAKLKSSADNIIVDD